MTTQDRLDRIAALVAKREENNEMKKQNLLAEREENTRLLEMEKQNLLDHIASYADRIKDMLLIANTLYNNNISPKYFEASKNKHNLGFVHNGDGENPYCAIGVLKQNYYPDHDDIIINEKGIAEKFEVIWDCEGWTNEFEAFENNFYNYVDNKLK